MASNGALKQRKPNGSAEHDGVLDHENKTLTPKESSSGSPQTVATLMICVGGIYASFLTWGILQERITTTVYGTATSPERFHSPVVVNTVQSIFAAALGYIYLLLSRKTPSDLPIYPTRQILLPMLMVSFTSSLASPFGYASLKYVDYITFTLAKSCKLLPVMLLHVTLFGRRYPWYKYLVVLLVTAGVAIFTLHQPSKKPSSKSSASSKDNNSLIGLALLSVNLLFDGLTNSTQDHIYKAFRPYTGQQMMCGLNILSTLMTTTYLMFEPFLSVTEAGAFFGMKPGDGELSRALDFVSRHPGVGWDILGFAACGALGQVFIFYTLSTFGSLLLVTVTVTRKMLTMILSVVWFGHRLSPMQWLGVGLVFGGVGVEAQLSKQEKRQKGKPVEKKKN
ncbi:hypothetical protein AAFC00_004598 [Neodothiora populina]|uniref:UDP-galactose transporter homolog 1 n=1 Tax=Neodothiora populina TaxID=2781224 RepID=A0ABR3P2V3_9PEZI